MGFNLNKNQEDSYKESANNKFHLSKTSGKENAEAGVSAVQEIPQKKFNLSKEIQVETITEDQGNKIEENRHIETTQVNKPGTLIEIPAKKNKTNMIFYAIGLIVVLLIVWYFTNNQTNEVTSDTNHQNSQTEQAVDKPNGSGPTIDQKQGDRGGEASDAKVIDESSTKPISTPAEVKSDQSASDIPYQKQVEYKIYQFPFGSFDYINQDPELDKLATVLLKNESLKISVYAYTDNVGTIEFNQALSDLRAKAIMNYLVSRGIAASRITSQGKGISSKYPTNAENRRAEFVITE